jgi:ribosomal protein S18 acetylase RimI-like enzyme
MSPKWQRTVTDSMSLDLLHGPEISKFVDSDSISWIHDASNPYWDWLWESENDALIQLKAWIGRPNSEISLNRITCIVESDRILGGFIALGGRELQQCRKADLLAFLNYIRKNQYGRIIEKMSKTKHYKSIVAEDEYYLSRMGVQPFARGKGLGKYILKAYISSGVSNGFKRFRLDVDMNNNNAIRLYEDSGFSIEHVAENNEVPFKYCSMTMAFSGESLT